MNTTKTWFGALILFFFVVVALAPLGVKYMLSEDLYATVYNQEEHHSCHINVIEPRIVLRMDDIRAYSLQSKPLIDEILGRDLSVTLGIIPRDLEKDSEIREYLLDIKENPNVEIAQHGTNHDNKDKDITEESLLQGNNKIQELLGIKPTTYIAPYNEITEEAGEIVSKYFRVISGREDILKEGEDIAEIGYTVKTYDYSKRKRISINEILQDCEESLDKTNVCVLTIHPQEYSSNIVDPIDLSEQRFLEFREGV